VTYFFSVISLIFLCVGQTPLHKKVTISFQGEPIRSSLVRLFQMGNINFIISNHFEENRTVFYEYKNKSLKSILEHFSARYHFEYTYAPEENFISVHYKPQTLKGYILTYTNDPVKDAIIYSQTNNTYTTSNENGYFYLENIVQPVTELQIKHVKFHQEKYKIPKEKYKEPQYVHLEHKIYRYTEQSVFQLPSLTYTPASSEVDLNKYFTEDYSTSDDVFQSIQLLPGISGVGDGFAKINNRGTSSGNNQVLFDDIPIYQSGHLNGFYSIFNPKSLDKIFLHRGVYSPKFGGHLSGVIELQGKHADFSKVSVAVGLNNLSYFGHVEFPLSNNFSVLVSGRKAFDQIINSQLYNRVRSFNTGKVNQISTGTYLSEIAPEISFYDVNTKLTYIPHPKLMFEFSWLKSSDESIKKDQSVLSIYGAEFSNNMRSENSINNMGYNIKGQYDWAENIHSTLSVSKSDYTFSGYREEYYKINDVRNDSSLYYFEDKNTLHETRTVFETDYFNETQRLNLGLSYRNVYVSDRMENIWNTISKSADQMIELSAYVHHKWKLNSVFKTDLGFRQNLNSSHTILYFEPRVSAIYEPKDDLSVKFSYGKFHQTLHHIKRQARFQIQNEFWHLANNESIPVSFTHKYQLGTTFSLLGGTYSVDIFKNTHKNLVNYYAFMPYDSISVTEGESRGAELLAEHRFSQFSFWVSYSFLKTDIPINIRSYKQSHKQFLSHLKLLCEYNAQLWTFSAQFSTQSGNFYQSDFNTEIDVVDAYKHGKIVNIHQLPSTHKLDLRISRRIAHTSIKWNLGLSILNLYNQKNILRREVNNASYLQEGDALFRDTHMLGITPMITVEAVF